MQAPLLTPVLVFVDWLTINSHQIQMQMQLNHPVFEVVFICYLQFGFFQSTPFIFLYLLYNGHIFVHFLLILKLSTLQPESMGILGIVLLDFQEITFILDFEIIKF